MSAQSLTAAAGVLRQFNRFYTAQIGLLDRHLLGSGRSLSEARVLYELATRNALTAADLTKSLGLDPGYLSRMLAGFEKEGLLERRRSAEDGRVSHLALTATGRAVFADLDTLSQAAAETLIARLAGEGRDELLAALGLIQARLGPDAPPSDEVAPSDIVLRPHRIGDMGRIVHRQAVLYARDYGWDGGYEALVAEITGRFLREFKPDRECCIIAESAGEIIGSVFAVEDGIEAAKLRLLYVEPSARGRGVGGRLVEACIAFARRAGYARLDLWTNDVLVAARSIYQRAGFALVKEERHHSFGHDLVGQNWSLDLSRVPQDTP